MQPLRIFLVLVLGVVVLTSCEDCTYETENIPFATVSFYNATTNQQIDTTFQKIVGVFVRTNELMTDSIGSYSEGTKYNLADKKRKVFELPIFSRADSSVFIFHRNNLKDTLALRYKVKVEVLPPDCGYDETISDLEVYFHTFERVEVFQSTLTQIKTADTHIKIYE